MELSRCAVHVNTPDGFKWGQARFMDVENRWRATGYRSCHVQAEGLLTVSRHPSVTLETSMGEKEDLTQPNNRGERMKDVRSSIAQCSVV